MLKRTALLTTLAVLALPSAAQGHPYLSMRRAESAILSSTCPQPVQIRWCVRETAMIVACFVNEPGARSNVT